MKILTILLLSACALFAQKPIGTGGSSTGGGTPGGANHDVQCNNSGLFGPCGGTGAFTVDGSGNVQIVGTVTETGCAAGTYIRADGAACSTPAGSGGAGAYTSVSFSATPTFTASTNTVSNFAITLTGNVTSSTLATPTTGQRLGFKICQDATGGRTFAWPTGFSNAATISPVASACTKQEFFWDGTNAIPLGSATSDGGPSIFSTEQAAPGTPAATQFFCWADSTDHSGLECKDNGSGNIFKMILTGIDINPVNGQLTITATNCTNQFVSAISARAVGTCTTITLAGAMFANQGTTTTVLHGNAGGNPSWTAILSADLNITTTTCTNQFVRSISSGAVGTCATVSLTADVSGVLPTANIAVALANQTSLRGNAMAAAAGNATIGQVIASGATVLDFASTATGACATVITATATGAASTDVIIFNANASIKAVTGYVPASTGGFSISAFPTTNTANFEACNWTAGTVDPGSITVNWVVIR